MTAERKQHWDNVYSSKAVDEVSWFQENPAISLELIKRCCPKPSCGFVDIGAGASRLADALVAEGYQDLTLLDISEEALQHTRLRLQDSGDRIQFISSDITEFKPTRRYQVWHDRAVFHFLTDAADRKAYIGILEQGLETHGYLIMAAFSLNGPTQCSGLDIVQYDADKIMRELGSGYALLEQRDEAHITPAGKQQDFSYFLIQKRT